MPRKQGLTFGATARESDGPKSNGVTVVCLGPVQPPHTRSYGKMCPLCEYKSEFFKSEGVS